MHLLLLYILDSLLSYYLRYVILLLVNSLDYNIYGKYYYF